MARAKKKEDQVEQVLTPDYALGVRIYRNDIKPATSKAAEFNQEKSEAFKALKKRAHLHPGAAKQAFSLDAMEESKRDHWLRSFNGLLREMNIFMPVDLVDQAEGKGAAGESVVPSGARPKPKLVTVPTGPEADALLESAADEVKAERALDEDGANDFLAKAREHLGSEQPQAAE